jgi:hypothetical protein
VYLSNELGVACRLSHDSSLGHTKESAKHAGRQVGICKESSQRQQQKESFTQFFSVLPLTQVAGNQEAHAASDWPKTFSRVSALPLTRTRLLRPTSQVCQGILSLVFAESYRCLRLFCAHGVCGREPACCIDPEEYSLQCRKCNKISYIRKQLHDESGPAYVATD